MPSPTLSKGYPFASGATVTPTRLNELVDEATLLCTQTDVLLGRSTSGAGEAEEIPAPAAARTLLACSSAGAQRTALGLGSIATQTASAVALTGGSAALDAYRANNDTVAYGATVTLDFAISEKTAQTLTLAGNVTFATSNRASGACKFLRIIGDGSARTLAFPAGWKFLNAVAPTALAAGKTAILCLNAWGTADTDITASYAVEP
jgi:hypothetical protein